MKPEFWSTWSLKKRSHSQRDGEATATPAAAHPEKRRSAEEFPARICQRKETITSIACCITYLQGVRAPSTSIRGVDVINDEVDDLFGFGFYEPYAMDSGWVTCGVTRRRYWPLLPGWQHHESATIHATCVDHLLVFARNVQYDIIYKYVHAYISNPRVHAEGTRIS